MVRQGDKPGPSEDIPSSPIVMVPHDSDSPLSPTPLMDLDVHLPAPGKRPLVQDPYSWSSVLLKPAKKGKTSSPRSPVKTIVTPTPVSNRFETLTSVSTAPDSTPTTQPPKVHRPPPIVLDPIYSSSRLATVLRENGIADFHVQSSSTHMKVLCKSQPTYDKTIALFRSTHKSDTPVSFHTFAPKGSKPNKKFLILGLDGDHDLDSIRNALTHPDLIDVRRLTSTRDGVTTETPNVLVTFHPNYIYNSHLKSIKAIDNILVRHKIFNTGKGQPTCGNCSQIGHTKRNCYRPNRCVRCGKDHLAKDCPPDTPLKCPNCDGAHAASYRQCPARIRLLQKSVASRAVPASQVAPPVPRHPPPPPPSVWGPPPGTGAFTPASRRLFPHAYPPPPSAPQVPLPPAPVPSVPSSPDSAPRWVTDLTNTLTSMITMLISTVENMLKALPQMLSRP